MLGCSTSVDGCTLPTERRSSSSTKAEIAPAELEAHILTHPDVQDTAVIRRHDDNAGEVPRAYVVLKPGSEAAAGKRTDAENEADIKDFVKEKVAHFKQLRGGVVFVDEIPKTASGKILRRNIYGDKLRAD